MKRKRTLTHKEEARRRLEYLGWTAGDVERRIPKTNITVDLFGCLDIVGVKDDMTIGLQVTSASAVAPHVKKMLAEPRLWAILAAGWICECWGVRGHFAQDGSFAVVRSFELNRRGGVDVWEGSSVL